ncbi:MAG: glucose 1-dehydrogenase [Gammaproteobacteria bacterium]
MQIYLDNSRTLVTGGSSGIGAALSRCFAAAGARVAINYRSQPRAAFALADELRSAGGEALCVQADVSDPRAVAAMFARLDETWGGIDVLVNNAGVDGARERLWESDPRAWARVIEVNLTGAYLCAREAVARMVAQRSGVVLNTSSVHEIIAWSGYSAYTASKAGLSMLAKSLAQEVAPFGVRVLCLAPGAIRTPINAEVWRDAAQYRDLLSKIPLGRLGRPEEVAQLAVVLASDVAAYMTATTVFVDGGMTAYPEFAHGG